METELKEKRICTILKKKLYKMIEDNDENRDCYESLNLKWKFPINNTEGMIALLKNITCTLGYVQKYKCSRKCIDDIIKNKIQPEIINLKDELDYVLGIITLVLCNKKIDFSDEKELKKCELEIVGKLIQMFEEAYKCFDEEEIVPSENDINSNKNIDTSGFEIGMVVKNYKEMCKMLGVEICEGNSKKAQLKEWARYLLWEKKGQKFIILDIYDTPLPKQDGRQEKNIYVQYIELILIKILSRQKESEEPFYFTTNQLWQSLGMINNKYRKISLDSLNEKITEYKVTSFDMNKFYQRCNQRLRDILFSSLNKLEDRALIKYEIETIIVLCDDNGEKNFLPANNIQKKQILKAEKKVLKDMGLESKRHVYAKFKETEFFYRMDTYLQEWYGWDSTFNCIKIIYNKEDILETVCKDEEKLKNDYEELKSQKLKLNDKVIEALYKNAQTIADNRHKKADQEYQEAVERFLEDEWGGIGSLPESFLPTKKDFRIFDYSPCFVEIQNKLTDELISIRDPQDRKVVIELNDDVLRGLDKLFKN